MTLRRSGWTQVALGDICEFRYGKSLPSGARRGMDFPVYGSNGVVGGNHAPLTKGETVIIGRKGSFGEVHYSPTACWPIDTTFFVDDSTTACNLRWLSYRLAGLGLKGLNKSAAVPGLNREDAYRQRLLLPPVADQRRIAEVLDKVNVLRATQGKAIAKIDDLMTSLFEEVSGQSQDGAAGKPLHEYVAKITVGHVGPTSEFFVLDGIPFLRTGNIGVSEIQTDSLKTVTREFHDSHKKSALSAGDILVSRVVSDQVRCAVVPAELAGSNCANVIIIRPGDRVSSDFLAHLIRSPAGQRSLLGRQVGSAQSVVNTGVFQAWKVTLPPLDVQLRFEAKAGAARKVRKGLVASSRSLDGALLALQRRAFAGEL